MSERTAHDALENRPSRLSADGWAERLRRFANDECHGSSPLYEALALGLANDPVLLDWLASASGARARATLPFAAVHYLLLRGVDGRGLEAFYANISAARAPAAGAYPAFREFCLRERDRLAPLLATRVTQTNEVRRCCYLLPALVCAARRTSRKLAIIDVGCSAGLNLNFDRYAYDYGNGQAIGDATALVRLRCEVHGEAVPTTPMPVIASRIGVDLEPIDVDDRDATDWLAACTWPEHVDRFESLRAAIDVARRRKPRLVKGNAVDLLPALAAGLDPAAAVAIVNTNVMFYFSREERVRFGEVLADLSEGRELFWIANEHPALLAAAGFTAPIAMTSDPAVLPLVMRHAVDRRREERQLAHVGPHGRWLEWLVC